MGCGCKNKGNEAPPPPQTNSTTNNSQVQTESVKDAIKKTIEKYYNVGKPKGSNGWVKE